MRKGLHIEKEDSKSDEEPLRSTKRQVAVKPPEPVIVAPSPAPAPPVRPSNNVAKTRVDLSNDSLARRGETDTFEELEKAGRKGSILDKFNNVFHDVLQSSRGSAQRYDAAAEAGEDPAVTADDLAISRAKSVRARRMVVPEGVIIEGAMTSGSETEIAGRVDGDVTVDGWLFLGPSALISGSVRTTSCKIEGLVDGRMECTKELELASTGRLNADALAARKMTLAGQVFGNVTCGGLLRLVSTARITGNVRTRSIVIEEGAVLNGACSMVRTKQKERSDRK